MNKDFAQKLIDKTRDDYNKIASQFASSRKYNWPDIKQAIEMLGEIKKDSKVLDVGAGAGRVSELFPKDVNYTGLDLSPALIKIAKKNYPERDFLVGNATELSFADEVFDIVVCIATLHHIPSRELREKAIDELYRVTKKGGKIAISVWYFWDKKLIKNLLPTNSEKIGLTDFLLPWKNSEGNKVTERYFHAWRKNELINTMKRAGFKNISVKKAKRKEKSNLIVLAQKV